MNIAPLALHRYPLTETAYNRIQHPDWVESNGDCPTCDSYESRLAELLGLTQVERGENAQVILYGLCRR
jgi:hypothetical protein